MQFRIWKKLYRWSRSVDYPLFHNLEKGGDKMWTKTRKALESRLADWLKKRVSYNFAVYSTNKYKYYMEMNVFYIQVDKKVWFASNPKEYSETRKNIIDIVET